jgi:Uma2 family endonuclease
MATTTHLLTWKEFEQVPDDGMHHELIEGEHQALPPPKSKHSLIADNVAKALRPLEVRGRVLWEAGYKLSDNPGTWIEPDVSFITSEHVLETDPDGHFLGGPDLAVGIGAPHRAQDRAASGPRQRRRVGDLSRLARRARPHTRPEIDRPGA